MSAEKYADQRLAKGSLKVRFRQLRELARLIDENTNVWCDKMGPCNTDCPFYHARYDHCILVIIGEMEEAP